MTTTPSPASRAAEQVSPDDLLGGFSQGTLLRWLLAALVIHAVVIGGLSIGTIRDWVDPEGAQARREALAAATKPAAPPDAAAPQGEAAPAPATTATPAPAAPAQPSPRRPIHAQGPLRSRRLRRRSRRLALSRTRSGTRSP